MDNSWLGAFALDMIGLAAFGMKLGAVSEMERANGGGDSGVAESYHSDLADIYKRLLYVPLTTTLSSIDVVQGCDGIRRNSWFSPPTLRSFLAHVPHLFWAMGIPYQKRDVSDGR